jgi:hypothetical protein
MNSRFVHGHIFVDLKVCNFCLENMCKLMAQYTLKPLGNFSHLC